MNILVVDDDKVTLRLLEKNIKKWGHSVYSAPDGIEALQILNSVSIDIVVSDWLMPEMSGLELCGQIRGANFKNYIYVIIVSAQDSQKDIVRGLESGIDDYVVKPINFRALQARINIGARVIKQDKELTRRYNLIKNNYFQTIQMFANMIEVFNEELGGHSKRVAKLSMKVAKIYPGISKHVLPTLETAALLHDIGMIGLPNEIIAKKMTELNGEEKELYLTHPIQGEIILNEIKFLQPIAKIVRSHHEQVNGRGFPDGLKGDKIPVLSKIIAAADAYDVLVHKLKVPLDDINSHLQRQRGYQLEPTIVDCLFEVNLEEIKLENDKSFVEISATELRIGMMLAKGIRIKNGTLVIPAGSKATSLGIEKLQNYLELGFITNKVYVYKDSLRG